MTRWHIEKDYPFYEAVVKENTDVLFQRHKRCRFHNGEESFQLWLMALEKDNHA